MEKKSLDLLFKPRNVVIFEAKERYKFFIEGFKMQGYDLEKLYLISPTEREIFGIECYKKIEDIPDDTIDLLILAVRRDILLRTLEEITDIKKIEFIHIFTAGTGEFDEIGANIEKQLKNFFDNHPSIKAIGPNCMGVYCPSGKTAYLPRFPLDKGNIGLIYHSGDLHSRAINYGYSRYRLTFSKGASIGNCVSLQVTDFLDYFEKDDEIDLISIYFEGFSKYQKSAGKELLKRLKKVKKPILFLRGGMTKRAQSAVQTHTGSLGSDEKIWRAIFNQTSLIEVGSCLDEMIDYMFIFDSFFKKYRELTFEKQIKYYPKGKNVLVIMWSGGLGILDTDTLTRLKLNLPLFEGKTKERLMKVFPIKIGSLNNPLDLPWVSRSEHYVDLCKAAISEDINLVIMHTNAFGFEDKERFKEYYVNLKEIREYVESLNKILILILSETPMKIRNDYYELLIDDGFIVYPSIERGAKSFLKLYEFGKKIAMLHNKNN
ncbi:MAG: CoA-binding protein [Promethearchaeota archaeon]